MKFTWEGGQVSAIWHGDPEAPRIVALTHGAAGNLDTPQLVGVAEGLAERGISTVRFNLPYAEAGRRSPAKPASDEKCWRAVIDRLTKANQYVYVGGRSYGGRIASHAVSQGAKVAGLIFLAYPLHPPGAPEKIRDKHLAHISAPMLFLQGSRDPFATPALLESVVKATPNATLHWIEGGDHSHKVSGRKPAEVITELVTAMADWIEQSSRGRRHAAPSHTTGHAGPHPAVRKDSRTRR